MLDHCSRQIANVILLKSTAAGLNANQLCRHAVPASSLPVERRVVELTEPVGGIHQGLVKPRDCRWVALTIFLVYR